MDLILASTSPYRRTFWSSGSACPSAASTRQVDEATWQGRDPLIPRTLAAALALAKAHRGRPPAIPPPVVIGGDQVVALDGAGSLASPAPTSEPRTQLRMRWRAGRTS